MHPYTRQFYRLVAFPLLFIVLLWVIRFVDEGFGLQLSQYGIFPRRVSGLVGILVSPLLHANYNHLISNSIPLLFLGIIMFYFYREIAFSVFAYTYLMTGLWVWIAGREAYHVGASGLIYSFVCFLFFSGLFRRNKRLMALSLLVTFLYGSLVWGVLPLYPKVSWESHFLGAVAGFIVAFFLRKEGPQREQYSWDIEQDEDEESLPENNLSNELKIVYSYKPKDEEQEHKAS